MILIERDEQTGYVTLTTEKGKEIGVWFKPWGGIAVCMHNNAPTAGRQFASLEAAIAAYKSPAIKAALSVLLPA